MSLIFTSLPFADDKDVTDVILHIGMRKTGSTAIQLSFGGYDNEHARMAVLNGKPHHTFELLRLFMADYDGWQQRSKDFGKFRPESDRRETALMLKREIKKARGRKLILSSETVSEKLTRIDIKRMRKWFESQNAKLHVLAYVRPPLSFAQSNFRQRLLAEGPAEFTPRIFDYQKDLFRDYLKIFRDGGLHFRPFSRRALKDGDIVADFAQWIEVPAPRSLRHNESSSLATLALAYAFDREMRPHATAPGQMKQAKKWIGKNCLFADAPPLRFSREVVEPLIKDTMRRFADEHMPADFLDEDDSKANVRSEADILAADPGWHADLEKALNSKKLDDGVKALFTRFIAARKPD